MIVSSYRLFTVTLLVVALFSLLACHGPLPPGGDSSPATSPDNSRYQIEDQWVALTAGRAEREIVSWAASREVTALLGEPVYGDLNGQGGADAAVLLVRQSGGSGSFYYLAAALAAEEGFQGSNAIFLGDRIKPLKILIRDGRILIFYADRRADESMAVEPTLVKSRSLQLVGGRLQESPQANWQGQPVPGWAIIGHEVRSFMPCDGSEQQWLSGKSAAIDAIKAVYNSLMESAAPYSPLYMVLDGASVSRPEDGFGRDYPAAFRADRFLEADPRGICSNPLIELERPVPGEIMDAKIQVSGRAKGNWYFEGDFPLLLVNGQGQTLVRGFAVAQGHWMTSDWVPFVGTLDLAEVKGKGLRWLVLKKDNPSEKRELDDALVVPVIVR